MAAYEYWRVEVQFTAGTWTDVTSDVDGPVRSTNGATPETTGEPASLSLVLHNPGFKYTPGNTSSVTALATGMPIRFFEVISDQYVYHFTGFVEFPEIGSVNLSMTQSQTIAVSAVDQLSSWERSSTFVSTLGAHIMGSDPAASLVAYYALNEPGTTIPAAMSSPVAGAPDAYVRFARYSSDAPTLVPVASVEFASGAGPVGDDVSLLSMVGARASGMFTSGYYIDADLRSTMALSSGDTFTWLCWVTNLSATTPPATDAPYQTFLSFTLGAGDETSFNLSTNSFNGGVWEWAAGGGSTSFDILGPQIRTDQIDLVGVQWTWGSAEARLWAHGQEYTGTVTGSQSSGTFTTSLQTLSDGIYGHWQVYKSASGTTAFSFADYQAQRLAGLTGLERQATGDRIKTLGRYAGLTDGQLVNVDSGCSIMQTARLAGQTVAQAMYEARDTEQGDLFVDGAGNLTFHDRRTILNI